MNTNVTLNNNTLALSNETGSVELDVNDIESVVRAIRVATTYRRDVERYIKHNMRYLYDGNKLLADTTLMNEIVNAYADARQENEKLPSTAYADKIETLDVLFLDEFKERLAEYAIQTDTYACTVDVSLYDSGGTEIEKTECVLLSYEKLSEKTVRNIFKTADDICSQDFIDVSNEMLIEQFRAVGKADIADNIEDNITAYYRYSTDGYNINTLLRAITCYLGCDVFANGVPNNENVIDMGRYEIVIVE